MGTMSWCEAIPFSFPGIAGVRCLFSTAAMGDMRLSGDPASDSGAVAARRRFMAAAGFARWAEVRQVHGDALVAAAGTPEPTLSDTAADGHHTDKKGVGLTIKTADCQPLFLARTDGGAVAALHVGWRGNAAGYPLTAVERLCESYSCSPGEWVAVRGPSLGPAASEFVNFDSEWPREFLPWFDRERKTVDLWELTRSQLEKAGLPRRNIFSLDLCTYSMPGVFFSYRRKDVGRLISAIWIV